MKEWSLPDGASRTHSGGIGHRSGSGHAVRGRWHLRWVEGHTLFHPDDLPMDLEAIPDIFTQFRKRWRSTARFESAWQRPRRYPARGAHQTKFCCRHAGPRAKPCHLPTAAGFAVQRWCLRGPGAPEALLLGHQKTRVTKDRNGLVGADYSSKFSHGWPTAASVPAYRQ